MAPIARAFDSVHLYLNEFASNVVAKSGKASDRFHLGKLILHGLSEYSDFVLQIDGATDEFDTYKTVLEKTVKCAISLTKLGLKQGDVLVIMAPNHLNLCIPMYAAFSLGVIVAPMDINLKIMELNAFFKLMEPKIIFCQSNKLTTIKEALINELFDPILITYDTAGDCTTLNDLINNINETEIKEFKPADFDTETTVAYLTSTSGSTGVPKVISLSHKNLVISVSYVWTPFSTFPTPTKLVLVISPVHWLSAGFHYLFAPILGITRLQSSEPATQDMIKHLINKYKPTLGCVLSPATIATLLKEEGETCDFTCFDCIMLGGSSIPPETVNALQKVAPKTQIIVAYGLSEVGGMAVLNGRNGSVGKPQGVYDCRLVDVETLQDIDDPYVNGELWLKGPTVCLGYYKNPEETKATIVEDGWIRSGDIFYRDEEGHLYFVERIKLLMKYKNYHISPTEVESVIHQHPGVLDVAVTSIEDQENGDLVVACVVPKPEYKITEQEIKDLVKENLSDAKQLRGGVFFMDELPLTSTAKIHRKQLKEMVRNIHHLSTTNIKNQ